jgi:hypothetical protein
VLHSSFILLVNRDEQFEAEIEETVESRHISNMTAGVMGKNCYSSDWICCVFVDARRDPLSITIYDSVRHSTVINYQLPLHGKSNRTKEYAGIGCGNGFVAKAEFNVAEIHV